jgi:hypothetical protein
MKCKKSCKEVVHFISPEMSALFDHAIINLPDGGEEYHSITQPRKWRVKGKDFGSTPMAAHQPYYWYTSEVKDGVTIQTPHMALPEIIYGAKYTGIDKADQYFKDIKKINKRVEELGLEGLE